MIELRIIVIGGFKMKNFYDYDHDDQQVALMDDSTQTHIIPHVKLTAMCLLGVVGALSMQQVAFAHGKVIDPPSRAQLCQVGKNVNCGPIQWEPHSLEGPDGFPAAGAVDGKIASANDNKWSPLDEQTGIRWHKTDIKSGPITIVWEFTAGHVSRDFRYYLTKPNWNPNAPLTRNSFDLNPFCIIDGKMRTQPNYTPVPHDCVIPDREGYQVILAVWDVGDTDKSFYNVIDVNFTGSGGGVTPPPVPQWTSVGTINPNYDLKAGDVAYTRIFNKNGEQFDRSTYLQITKDSDGASHYWPYLLAKQVNAERSDIQAGSKGTDGTITPVHGLNEIFAAPGTDVTRVEVSVKHASQPELDLAVSNIKQVYTIDKNGVVVTFSVVTFSVKTDLKAEVEAILFNNAGTPVGFETKSVGNDRVDFGIVVSNPVAGSYQLVVKALDENGTFVQKNFDVMLQEVVTPPEPGTGDYDYVFPNNLSSYKAGTKVFQSKTGNVYQCKPFPYSGYCVQWSTGATQFEPGVGSHWQEAWVKVN